jgi:diguanylate cyclase (GGDEF)-like protein
MDSTPRRESEDAMSDPGDRLRHRTALLLLLAGALAAGSAALLHEQQPHPHRLDLWLPLALMAVLSALCLWLWRSPRRFGLIAWMSLGAALAGIAIPAWHYALAAWNAPATRLVDSLPPIGAPLLPLLLAMIVFVRVRAALVAATVAWAIVATPVLAYLLLHPDELVTPRGLDLAITLGPVMMLVLLFLPFQRGIDRWVSALQRERAEMQQLAERDSLTGLYNRRAGEALLANLLAEPDAHDALVLFDVDHFKRINDQHGHAVGDAVLREIARRCRGVLRNQDVFARWGGEEFLVLVRGTAEGSLAAVAETLRGAICATPIESAGRVTASFGAARYRARDSVGAWLQRADATLYRAKDEGRDRVVLAD